MTENHLCKSHWVAWLAYPFRNAHKFNKQKKRKKKLHCNWTFYYAINSKNKFSKGEEKKERLRRSAGKCEIKKYNARSKHADHQTLIVMKCVYDAFDDEKDTDTDTHRWRHHRPILLHTIANESFVRNSVLDYLVKVKFLCADFSLLCSIFFLFLGIFFSLFHLSVRTDHCEQFSLLLIFFFFPSIFL